MTRKRQLILLILLSALTATCQYVLQGALAMGENPSDLPKWFFMIDFILWGVRALVECFVIVYVISSSGKTKLENFVLIALEVVLISVITLTVGPAIRAAGLGLSITESLSETYHGVWSYLLASYTSLMMLGAAAAYRIQPNDYEAESIDDLRRYTGDLIDENTTLRQNLVSTEMAVEAWNLFNGTEKSKLIASINNEIDKSKVAEAIGVSEATVTRGFKQAND